MRLCEGVVDIEASLLVTARIERCRLIHTSIVVVCSNRRNDSNQHKELKCSNLCVPIEISEKSMCKNTESLLRPIQTSNQNTPSA